MIRIARVVVLALTLPACRQEQPAQAGKEQAALIKLDRSTAAIPPDIPPPAAAPAPYQRPAAGVAMSGQVALPRMLTRNGVAVLEVASLDPAVTAVRALAAHVGGWIAGENIQSGRDQLRQAVFQVMVPAARLDEAIAALKPIGKIESVQIESQDVGQEYVDVNARLSNQKRLEQRLVTLLDTRTGKLEDVLAVERELARVREEIDQLTGRSQYLERQVATSRLQVSVHEPAPLTGSPGSSVLDPFRAAGRNFLQFLAGFIAALGFLVPLALIVAAVWWGAGALRRRRHSAKSDA